MRNELVFDTIITKEYLELLFEIDILKGTFIRKISRSNRIKIGDKAGNLRKDGYLQISIDNKLYLSHRLIWLYAYGVFPKESIDHIDGNRSNNSILNLRECNNALNMQNRKQGNINNSSKYLGVSYCKLYKKYKSRIQLNKKRISLGYYNTAEEAHLVYLNAKKKYHIFNTL